MSLGLVPAFRPDRLSGGPFRPSAMIVVSLGLDSNLKSQH